MSEMMITIIKNYSIAQLLHACKVLYIVRESYYAPVHVFCCVYEHTLLLSKHFILYSALVL